MNRTIDIYQQQQRLDRSSSQHAHLNDDSLLKEDVHATHLEA
jgi:hypothetical protein